MTWDDETNQKLEDDLRRMMRIQNCRWLIPYPEVSIVARLQMELEIKGLKPFLK